MKRYSAYHNIDPLSVSSGQYPALLTTTSTRDDRVHPYHARCFTKRMIDIHAADVGIATNDRVLYYENIEGGHGGAANNKQQAFMNVSAYTTI